jgi:hypothetical protein
MADNLLHALNSPEEESAITPGGVCKRLIEKAFQKEQQQQKNYPKVRRAKETNIAVMNSFTTLLVIFPLLNTPLLFFFCLFGGFRRETRPNS